MPRQSRAGLQHQVHDAKALLNGTIWLRAHLRSPSEPPIFEADFLEVSYGFRPKRSALDAVECIRVAFPRGRVWVAEADIRDYFGSIDQQRLLALVAERVSDRRVLKLLRLWLQAGVMDDEALRETVTGTPQGGDFAAAVKHLPARLRSRVRGAGHRHARPLCG